ISPILPAADVLLGSPITYEWFKRMDTSIGSATVIVLDESVNMFWAAQKMTNFFAHESCGQCTPCREGTYWLKRLYGRVADGLGNMGDVETMNSVAGQMRTKCICALGEFAVNPVMATIKHFPDDYVLAVQPAAAQPADREAGVYEMEEVGD